MKKTYIWILVVVVVIAAAALIFWPSIGGLIAKVRTGKNNSVACTMEAKICPDGSSVGRVGPNCEFAECPSGTVTSSTPVLNGGDATLGVGQTGKIGNLSITLNKIAQDSRCPSDVQCIWAGLVEVNVTLVAGANSETKNIKSTDAPYTFFGNNISITGVKPYPESKKTISAGDYRVTFHSAVDESQL